MRALGSGVMFRQNNCPSCEGRGFVKLCSAGTIADIKGSIAGRVTGREDQLWSLCKCQKPSKNALPTAPLPPCTR
jgi:hypothetical protein